MDFLENRNFDLQWLILGAFEVAITKAGESDEILIWSRANYVSRFPTSASLVQPIMDVIKDWFKTNKNNFTNVIFTVPMIKLKPSSSRPSIFNDLTREILLWSKWILEWHWINVFRVNFSLVPVRWSSLSKFKFFKVNWK